MDVTRSRHSEHACNCVLNQAEAALLRWVTSWLWTCDGGVAFSVAASKGSRRVFGHGLAALVAVGYRT